MRFRGSSANDCLAENRPQAHSNPLKIWLVVCIHDVINYTYMKVFGMLSVMAVVMCGWITSYGQEMEPEVPGDHFSLEGALELFKRSESPEEFEKMLNSPDSKVNNLDLNADGYIDYIRVIDRYEGNVHAFILQAMISESESQDIAVIELEKFSDGKAVLQIVGNADIYGVETIIEPTREVRTYAGTTTNRTVVNVWAWPSVRYIYGPHYHGWISPWHWHYHPVWWRPWRPITYVHYYTYWRPYRHYYDYCPARRIVYAHKIYSPHRRSSVIVHDRYHSKITRYRTENRDRYRDDDRRRTTADYARRDRSSLTPGTNNDRPRTETRTPQPTRRDDYLNRRPSGERQVVTPNRAAPRDRDAAGTYQRNTPRVERSAPQSRQHITTPDNGRSRQQMTNPPGMNRSSIPQQRTINRERTAPAPIQRSAPEYRRSEVPARRSSMTPNPPSRHEPSRQPNMNRSAPTSRPSAVERPSRSQQEIRGNETRRGRQ